MANEIPRIQANNSNYSIGGVGEKPENRANSREEEAPQQPQVETPQVSADDVMAFMNAQSAAVRPKETPRVLDISKYVTPEQAQRISSFVLNTCCASMDGYKDAIKQVLGDNVLTEDALTTLAAEMFNRGMQSTESFITPEQIGSFLAQFGSSVASGLNAFETADTNIDRAKEMFEK